MSHDPCNLLYRAGLFLEISSSREAAGRQHRKLSAAVGAHPGVSVAPRPTGAPYLVERKWPREQSELYTLGLYERHVRDSVECIQLAEADSLHKVQMERSERKAQGISWHRA